MPQNPQELKGLIDSTPNIAVLLNLAGYCQASAAGKGRGQRGRVRLPAHPDDDSTAVKGTRSAATLHRVR
jgi:hypothetical protein